MESNFAHTVTECGMYGNVDYSYFKSLMYIIKFKKQENEVN